MLSRKHLPLFLLIFLFFIAIVTAATFVDNSQGHFDNGTYNNTEYNTTGLFVELTSNDTKQELANDRYVETFNGGINMAGNILLMHLNNDSTYGENDTHVYDFSGNGNNGTGINLNGDEVTGSGKLNGAIEFDGVDDYFNYSIGLPQISESATVTISAWIKPQNKTTLKDIIVIRDPEDDLGERFFLQTSSSGYFFTQTTGGGNSLSGETSITLDRWYYVTAVVNGQNLKLYVDGVLDGENAALSDTTSITADKLTIGAGEGYAATRFFDGFLDEVSIWNRSLLQDEILENYNRQKGNYISKGEFTSQIFDSGGASSWNNISWVSNTIGELPPNQVVETSFANGNANMSGNVLLLHLNNDSNYGENDTYVYDFSGNGNDGTGINLNGDEVTGSGKLNGAIEFDGVDDCINLGGNVSGDSLDLSVFTISAWINYDAPNPSGASIVAKRDTSGYQYQFRVSANNLNLLTTGGSVTDTTDLSANKWYHVVASRDGSNVKFYVNGKLSSSPASKSISYVDSSAYVGCDLQGGVPELRFNGTIDEIAIWNRSISSEEVLDIYKRGSLKLNLSVQSCDDASCSGESFTNLGNNLNSPQNLSISNNQYFQYKFEFENTENNITDYSPELYNFTADYSYLNSIPTTTLNSPENISYQDSVSSVLLNATVYDVDLDSMTVWFYGDGGLISTNTSQTNGTSVTYNWTDLSLGEHNWTVILNDGSDNSTESYFYFTLINLTVNCEAGGGYQQGALVLVQGNVSNGTNAISSYSVNLTVINSSDNLDASADLTSVSDGGFETTFSGLAVGSYTLYANTSYQGFNETCTDNFVIGSSAEFVLDKIVTIYNITNTTINYNISLRTINKGGSSATSTTLTDTDSGSSPYDLTTVTANSTVLRSYLKEYTRNSTTYNASLVESRVNGTDSYSGTEIEGNSSPILLSVPATTANEQLTLTKNAYYNSENSTAVNYTLSIEVVNSGGVDLTSISVIDTDLDIIPTINLNRTQNWSYSSSVVVDKAASNTNKLFVKTSATVNSATYQSNQIQVRIPGYGGPADAIVAAPASVQTSTSFDSAITVENQNEDIGQDFTIDYWITNNNEDTNYTSGQQTIYVASSGSSDLTATLNSPANAGTYRLRSLVTWAGGTATAFDSFAVTATSSESETSGDSSGGGGGITGKTIYELEDNEIDWGIIFTLKDGEKTKFNITQNETVYSHSLEIIDLQSDKATIVIYSQPITISIYLGEKIKLDLNGDGFYDLYIKLRNIEDNKAHLYLKSMYEEIEEGVEVSPEENELFSGEQTSSLNIINVLYGVFTYLKQNKLYFIVGFVVLALILLFVIFVLNLQRGKSKNKVISGLETKLRHLKELKNKKKISKKSYTGEKEILLQKINRALKNTGELIGKRVYTDSGHYLGKVEEVIIKSNKIDSLKIRLDKKQKFVVKGVIIKYKGVKGVGHVIIVNKLVFDKIDHS